QPLALPWRPSLATCRLRVRAMPQGLFDHHGVVVRDDLAVRPAGPLQPGLVFAKNAPVADNLVHIGRGPAPGLAERGKTFGGQLAEDGTRPVAGGGQLEDALDRRGSHGGRDQFSLVVLLDPTRQHTGQDALALTDRLLLPVPRGAKQVALSLAFPMSTSQLH